MKKLWKYFFEILVRLWRNLKWGERSLQIFKHFDGNFVIFSRQFLENLVKNFGEKFEIILRKFRKNPRKLQRLPQN